MMFKRNHMFQKEISGRSGSRPSSYSERTLSFSSLENALGEADPPPLDFDYNELPSSDGSEYKEMFRKIQKFFEDEGIIDFHDGLPQSYESFKYTTEIKEDCVPVII